MVYFGFLILKVEYCNVSIVEKDKKHWWVLSSSVDGPTTL